MRKLLFGCQPEVPVVKVPLPMNVDHVEGGPFTTGPAATRFSHASSRGTGYERLEAPAR